MPVRLWAECDAAVLSTMIASVFSMINSFVHLNSENTINVRFEKKERNIL